MKKNAPPNRIMVWWRNLHLVDRLLLIFMTVLLTQSVGSLFFYECTAQNSETLNAVLHTTAASIFGYFISAGFRGTSSQDGGSAQEKIGVGTGQNETGNPNARVGFSEGTEIEGNALAKNAVSPSGESIDRRLRQRWFFDWPCGCCKKLVVNFAIYGKYATYQIWKVWFDLSFEVKIRKPLKRPCKTSRGPV